MSPSLIFQSWRKVFNIFRDGCILWYIWKRLCYNWSVENGLCTICMNFVTDISTWFIILALVMFWIPLFALMLLTSYQMDVFCDIYGSICVISEVLKIDNVQFAWILLPISHLVYYSGFCYVLSTFACSHAILSDNTIKSLYNNNICPNIFWLHRKMLL